MRIGITGVNGFIGWHLRAFFYQRPDAQVVSADRTTFRSKEALLDFVSSSDVIVHMAGMHCGDDKEIAAVNLKLADDLIAACECVKKRPHIIFASSIHIYRNTVYGDSKKTCTEKFQNWAKRSGGTFTNMILPNVFGEGGKPFFNSVVATFCYQIAKNEEPKIIVDGHLDLIHAQSLSAEIDSVIKMPGAKEVRPVGVKMTVGALLAKLLNFADSYVGKQIIPNLEDPFDLQLFNTYRSYLYPQHYPVKISQRTDIRGNLFEAVKSQTKGQCFISNTNSGVTRGNHYHRSIFERFLVTKGAALVRIRKLFSDSIIEFRVDGCNPRYIDIPTLHTHSITNVGKDNLETLFWANRLFDPKETDTYPEQLELSKMVEEYAKL